VKKSVLFLLAALCGVPHAGVAEKIAGGPYTVNVGTRSATVMWIVQTGQASLGTAPGKLDEIGPALHAEKVTFTRLTPGTTYYYNVTGTTEGQGSFKTAPRGESSFQFVVYGDTRTRHDVHRRVIEAILKHADPELVLHTGDLVANGADTSLWPVFFDIERELLRKTAFFPALGNHERNDRTFYDFFDLPATPYYSFNWGACHFIILDSDIRNVSTSDSAREAFWTEQVRWLEEDLQKSQSADFRFVFAHHPPMTAVARRQGANPEMTALMPMFEKYKLTAGFFGHDHNYQHYLNNGVHYFITGGGGAPLYDVDKPPAGITRKVARTENFVVVNVKGHTAHVDAFTPDGETLDTVDLHAESSPVAGPAAESTARPGSSQRGR
jgi:3',5'-cyclic AMP phosphodiesterase CpdA